MKILVIEDHPKIRGNILMFLKKSWYVGEGAVHWREALEKIAVNNYDVLILDVNMPIMNGKEFLKELRKKEMWKNIPVLALTSNSMLENTLEMFELGVDDYMTKPFELRELEVRLQSLARRKNNRVEESITIDDVVINMAKHKVFFQNKEVIFWNKHFLILEFLAKNKNFPQSKLTILEKVWWEIEENLDLNSTTLEAHISVIRKKLWKNIIKTIKGVGYIIE